MSKSQVLVIQFLLFFLLGLAIFIAIGNLFRFQLDIFATDILRTSLELTKSYIDSALIYSAYSCKQCDRINLTLALPEKIAHHYFKIALTSQGINVSILDRPEHYFSPPHNLNYTFDLSGEAYSPKSIALTFDRTKYKLE